MTTEEGNQLPDSTARARTSALASWRPLRRPARALEDQRLMPWGLFLARRPIRLLARLAMPRFGRRVGTRCRSIKEAGHVAVVHWDSLGDAVLLTPVLRELRRTLPHARIVLVCNANNQEVFVNCPYIDSLQTQTVQVSSISLLGASGSRRQALDAAKILAGEARRHGPIDLVVGPDWLDPVYGASFFDGALFCAGGGGRILRHRGGADADIDVRQHFVLRNLNIAHVLGVEVEDDRLEFWTASNDVAEATELLAGLRPDRPIVALGVGASASRRQWPADRFAHVADVLVERLAAQVVLVGAEDAKCAAEEVQAQSNKVALNLVGKTSIGVLGELLRRADLVVGNDSGPIHIAAAVGTSAVVVSQHPVDGEPWVVNSPNRYRPWGVRSIVLQPPTGLESCVNWPTCLADDPHCILSVSDVEVAEAAMMLLATDGLITNGS